jgi:hypothetical protein
MLVHLPQKTTSDEPLEHKLPGLLVSRDAFHFDGRPVGTIPRPGDPLESDILPSQVPRHLRTRRVRAPKIRDLRMRHECVHTPCSGYFTWMGWATLVYGVRISIHQRLARG